MTTVFGEEFPYCVFQPLERTRSMSHKLAHKLNSELSVIRSAPIQGKSTLKEKKKKMSAEGELTKSRVETDKNDLDRKSNHLV